MKHIFTGLKGEILARKYLKAQKYKILEKNYKTTFGEIDIIALDNNYIVFVEVKARTSTKFGRASEAVDKNKQRHIKNVALGYLKINNLLNSNVRFDVIEVYDEEINHIKNAF